MDQPLIPPPSSREQLLERADAIAGRTLAEVAERVEEPVPPDLSRNKGWVGQLIEKALGAHAGNAPVPDFVELGIELKTLPVDRTGKPLESTYVCMVPLSAPDDVDWESSTVRHKLGCVLWTPVLAEREIPLGERMVGQSMLWEPDAYELALLRRDWEGHLDAIRHGAASELRGHDGEVLQIRPKGADAAQLTWGVDERGEAILTRPRGFYLRTLFTEMLVRQRYMT